MGRVIYGLIAVICIAYVSACAGVNSRGTVDVWNDAALVSEQRLELERLRQDITDMEKFQREISDRIEWITDGLIDSLERCETIEDIFREVDVFVRTLIDENQQLRALQRTDSGENAGE